LSSHTFRVWAPSLGRVDLLLEGRKVVMEAGDGGWWERAIDAAPSGTRYHFRAEGAPPFADPRSMFQPEGISGSSELVDHAAFRWSDAKWRGLPLRGAVLYELHVGTFTPQGTFEAAIERLPHLVELGVDAVQLMPVAEFPGKRGWGYDGICLYAPHHAYGGPIGLKRFVDACHDVGIGVVLDVVYNHLGPGNRVAELGPYFTSRYATPWGSAMNFDDAGSYEVRRFVIDNALMWMRDYHVDGLRLDAVHAIADASALHILEELSLEVEALASQLRKPLFLIAESDLNDPRLVRSRDAGGHGLDAVWSDEWHHALHATLTGERSGYYEDFGSVEVLAKALTRGWVHEGGWSSYRGRAHGKPATGLDGKLVVATQTHDQVGNRAAGERLMALVPPGRARVAAALLLTSPFVPMLFQGEEWGASTPFQYFTDHESEELRRAVREGRRREFAAFGWDAARVPDPQDAGTFERSVLDWSEPAQPPHREMLAWYRDLIALRRSRPELTDPRVERIHVTRGPADDWLIVRRGGIHVVVCLAAREVVVPVGNARLLLASEAAVRLCGGNLVLPAESVAVLETVAR
jgi:maltooligosyltrehalose trehalohydrolase